MNAAIAAAFWLPLLVSCSTGYGDHRCAKLVSSKGDALYVKTYNWGITGDGQLSTLAGDAAPIGFADRGNAGVVNGLEPFLYRFEQDTLTLYSRSHLPPFSLPGSSITVRYQVVDNPDHMNLRRLADHSPYYRVPEPQPGDASYQLKL